MNATEPQPAQRKANIVLVAILQNSCGNSMFFLYILDLILEAL